MIEKNLTGHMYFNSPIELADNCGTCNGANCDNCKELWVTSDGESYYNKEEAMAYEEKINTLLPGNDFINDFNFIIKDDKLFYRESENKIIECNEDSVLYATKLDEIKRRMSMYKNCKCTDKDRNSYGNDSCKIFGCRDTDCNREMKAGATEKKYYI